MDCFPLPLLQGYQAFKSGVYKEQKATYDLLSTKGQAPTTLVIACCDSRCAPETIFNAAPGQLFVIRNVANLVPPYMPNDDYHGTSAALEFAIQALKIRDILIMGHGQCGGIKAALDPALEPLSPGDFIGKWISLLNEPVQSITNNNKISPTARQTALERLSIQHSIENLRTFPCVSELEARQKLRIHGAWFDIGQGQLWISDQKGNFTPID